MASFKNTKVVQIFGERFDDLRPVVELVLECEKPYENGGFQLLVVKLHAEGVILDIYKTWNTDNSWTIMIGDKHVTSSYEATFSLHDWWYRMLVELEEITKRFKE